MHAWALAGSSQRAERPNCRVAADAYSGLLFSRQPWGDDWNEREMAEFVAAFVRRERRLPGYLDLTNRHATDVAVV